MWTAGRRGVVLLAFVCAACVIAALAGPAEAVVSLRAGVLVRRADRTGFELHNDAGRLVQRISTGRVVPATAATLSPDARWLAFVGQDDFLWVVSADGRRRRRLVGALRVAPVWSPDERMLAIQARDGHAGEVAWPSGRLTEADLPGDRTLSFSPDGWLWAAEGDILNHIQFEGVPPGARGPPQPFGQPALDDLWAGSSDAVAISPDGVDAAYLRYEGTGSLREALYEQTRGGAQQLVVVGPDFSHAGGHLAFSPDGGMIAVNWTTPQNGLFGQLWLIPAGGGAPRVVNLTTDLFAQPEWSPNASTVAIGLPGGGVALVDRDGAVREPRGLRTGLDPTWANATARAARERVCLTDLGGLGLAGPGGSGPHRRARFSSCSAWHPITGGGRTLSATAARDLPHQQSGTPQVSTCTAPAGARPFPLFFSAPGATAWLQNRQSYCASGGVFAVRHYYEDSGISTEVGEGRLIYTVRIGTQTDQPRGSTEFEFGYQGLWGTIQTGAWFKIGASCDTPRGASCLGSEPSFTDFVPSGEVRVDDWRLQAPRLGQRDRVTEFVGFDLVTWPNGGSPELAGFVLENAAPRCDTIITRRGGCVFPDYIPTLFYSLSDPSIAQTAAHIQSAQLMGYPGAPSSRDALTRTMDRAKIRRNRRLACRGFKVMAGGSCDEYPFASTEQGEAFGHKVSPADVPLADNVAAGRQLGIFYGVNRVIGGDPFYVQITP